MSAQTYTVTGMDCMDCAVKLEKGVGRLEGVQSAHIDFAACKLYVEGNASPETIRERVEFLGYGLADPAASTDRGAPGFVAFCSRAGKHKWRC